MGFIKMKKDQIEKMYSLMSKKSPGKSIFSSLSGC